MHGCPVTIRKNISNAYEILTLFGKHIESQRRTTEKYEMFKVNWSTRLECGTKKIWVPDSNRTHDVPNTIWAPYQLSYEISRRARSFNWVQLSSFFTFNYLVLKSHLYSHTTKKHWQSPLLHLKENNMSRENLFCSTSLSTLETLLR